MNQLCHFTITLICAINLINAQSSSLWTRTYGGSWYDWGKSVQQVTDGGFIVTGMTSTSDIGGDVWLIRTDAQGDSLWAHTYGGSSRDEGLSVKQTADSGFVIAGSTYSFGMGLRDIWLLRTNAQGDILWTSNYGGSGEDVGNSVQQTMDGGFVVAGMTNSFGAGESDVWLIKTNSLGDTTALAIDHHEAGLPAAIDLHQNYPNPFNPGSTIRFDLPRASNVSLIVYDILGREVAGLVDSYSEPGYHQMQWNGRDQSGQELPSGIYIARLVTPEYTKSIKMLLLK